MPENTHLGLSGGRGALLEQCRVANIACCEELVEEFSDNALLRAGADAAVRVVLEHLRAEARLGGNLDDGLWCERLQALLEELPDA